MRGIWLEKWKRFVETTSFSHENWKTIFIKRVRNWSVEFTQFLWIKSWGESKIKFFCTQCGYYGNFLSLSFGKNFVKVTSSLKKLLNSWFDEIFLRESKLFIFPHCAVQVWCEITLRTKKNSVKWSRFFIYFHSSAKICWFHGFFALLWNRLQIFEILND